MQQNLVQVCLSYKWLASQIITRTTCWEDKAEFMAQESKEEHPRVLVDFLRRKGKAWKLIEILSRVEGGSFTMG